MVLALAPSRSNAGGWSATPGNDIERLIGAAQTEIVVWASDDIPTTNTTGVLLNYTCTGSEVNGDQISASSITPTTGARTLAINFTDDDSTVSTPVFTVVGKAVGNITATEVFWFDETDHSTNVRTLYGSIPFLATPEIKVYITQTNDIESGDLLDVNPWGFFVWGCPSRYQDIGCMEFLDATGPASSSITVDATYFSNYFSPRFFSWNPPPLDTGGVTALAAGDRMRWWLATSNLNASDPSTEMVSGSVYNHTVKESDD